MRNWLLRFLRRPIGMIQTILKTGLHRTVNEIAKQKIASNTLVGGNISYKLPSCLIGMKKSAERSIIRIAPARPICPALN